MMHHTRALTLFVMMQAVMITARAQNPDTTQAAIDYKIESNEAVFNATLRPLSQIAGAPAAFYTYFWEFGDGTFSFEKNPRHWYKDTGTFNARLYATNNYDDGKPPPARLKPVKVRSKSMLASNSKSSFFKEGGSIEMKVNRMPRPDEDMVLIIGYRNEKNTTPVNGSLVLFFNEKQFHKNNFDLTDERAYYGEKKSDLNALVATIGNDKILESPIVGNMTGPKVVMLQAETESGFSPGKFTDLLKSKQQIFRQNNTWKFGNLQRGEEKFFFLTLHTTPEMIKDTNAVVTLTGMFIPDNGGDPEEYLMELQIVASHDPNRMMLKNHRLNYRFTGSKKENAYRVRFQNTGKGPARLVSVGIAIPPMLNSKSVEIVDFSPRCALCDSTNMNRSCLDTVVTKDSIHFIFRNIYLPGMQQEGFSDADSTKGFVRYRIRFNKKMKKLPFDSRAAIIFDKNEPVLTNHAWGKFKPGKSPGIVIGFNRLQGTPDKRTVSEKYWVVGATLSQYAPYKKYLQWELFVSNREEPEQLIEHAQFLDTTINNQPWRIIFRDTYEERKVTRLDVVPLQGRYNINDFIGAGVGTQVTFDAITTTSYRQPMQLIQNGTQIPVNMEKTFGKETKGFNNWDISLFADLQVGKVRAGPAVGFRFLHYFREPQNRLFFYGIWRL